jgi:hypothetical protein
MSHTRARLLLAVTVVLAGTGTAAGSFLPWLTTFAGLHGFAAADGLFGQVLAGLGAVVALAGLVLAWRQVALLRWVLLVAALAAALLSGWLLAGTENLYADLAADPFTVAGRGPGGFVALASALVAVALALAPLPGPGGRVHGRRSRTCEDGAAAPA